MNREDVADSQHLRHQRLDLVSAAARRRGSDNDQSTTDIFAPQFHAIKAASRSKLESMLGRGA
jgi:hypothetical protein